MSTLLQPVITESGLAAVWRATNDGVAAQITHIAIGDVGYTPIQTQTAMHAERARYPIADGTRVSNQQIHLTALADGPGDFWVREVAFLLADGTVFAVWSHPTSVLAYKTADIDLLLAFDLELSAIPADSITVQSTGAQLSLFMAGEYTALAIAELSGMLRELKRDDQIDAFGKKTAQLDQKIDVVKGYTKEAQQTADDAEALGNTLGKIAAWQTESHANIVRGMGQTGYYISRAYGILGDEQYSRPFAESFAPSAIHNHPNYDGMPGTAEASYIVNGYYLRTRHNDYLLGTPAPVGSPFLALERVDAPQPPTVVTSAVDLTAQVAAMRGLFNQYLAGAMPEGFGWTMSYVEFWFEPYGDSTSDTFSSFRHTQYFKNVDDAFCKNQLFSSSGLKDTFENVSEEAPAVRWIKNGKPVFARLRYRMASVDVSSLGDMRQHIQPIDDQAINQRFGRNSERFKVTEAQNTEGFLDRLMGLVPGLDGRGAYIEEKNKFNTDLNTVLESRKADGVTLLNAGYYNRWVSIARDAAGRDVFHRGFNDPTLFVASNTRKECFSIESDGLEYRHSYAIPFELVLRTPLEQWNPKNIPEVTTYSGNGTQATPYNGWNRDSRNYKVPNEFYGDTGGSVVVDPADTGGGTAWVADASGTPQLVRASGIYRSLPSIEGVNGEVQIRYPIFPVYHEGSHAFAELQAVRKTHNETLAAIAKSLLDTQQRQLDAII